MLWITLRVNTQPYLPNNKIFSSSWLENEQTTTLGSRLQYPKCDKFWNNLDIDVHCMLLDCRFLSSWQKNLGYALRNVNMLRVLKILANSENLSTS